MYFLLATYTDFNNNNRFFLRDSSLKTENVVINYSPSVTVHGFPVPSSPCLVCVRVRMCEQVSVGVCDWGWFAPAESHHRWAISVPVTLSPLSDPCSVCGRRLRSVLVPRFLSPAASWTPITGPLAAHCFPALPASALRRAPFLPTESSASALRKAPFLPTESSVSAYGKLRLCPTESSVSAYGKLRLCPTESSVSAYGKLRLCLRRAPLLVLAVYYFL